MRVPWLAGQWVEVAVPASSANLGPGFDSVGVGLEVLDRCRVTVTDTPGIGVEIAGEGWGTVPLDERHLVARALLRAWQTIDVQPPVGLHLHCRNVIPHGRGMGSSAAAIVAGVGAAYALHALAVQGRAGLDLPAINDLAAELEGHPDNSSACVYGGMTLSWADDDVAAGPVPRTRTVRLAPHPRIRPILLVPEAELSTATARAVLPGHVRLADAAANAARVGALVHAMTQDPDLLLPGTRDFLHQEPRRASYAASMAVVDALRAAGIAATISGAGPTVLALAVGNRCAEVAAYAPGGWRVLDPGFATRGIRLGDGE